MSDYFDDPTRSREEADEIMGVLESGRISRADMRRILATLNITLSDWAYSHMLNRVEQSAADDDDFGEAWNYASQDEQEAYLNDEAALLADTLSHAVEHFEGNPLPDWMED